MDSIALIKTDELKQLIAAEIKPLQQEIELLRLHINHQRKPMLTIKEFSQAAGRCASTVRTLVKDGKLSYTQPGPKSKILIPSTELIKLKQL